MKRKKVKKIVKKMSANLRTQVLIRDKLSCKICGAWKDSGTLEVHHRDGNDENNVMNNLISVCKHPCHTKLHPINLDRTLINLLKESKKRLRNYGKPSDLIGKPQDTYDKIITSIGDKLALGKKHRKNLIKANKTISHLKDTISKLKEEYSNKK